jgi:hypothetical protein
VRRLERELREAREEQEKRLQDTPQFRQLQVRVQSWSQCTLDILLSSSLSIGRDAQPGRQD